MTSSDDLADFNDRYREIQRIQSEYRARLLAEWAIPAGSRVLEIGCGQGDMTALLAGAVGPTGHVTAVDIADPSYGAPLTLGQATDIQKRSEVGDRIDFRFRFDVLDAANDFPADTFDYVVLVHSSWYFASQERLAETLRRVHFQARRLCFVEWDMTPHGYQRAHMLAVLIQGQVEAFKTQSEANIRTPVSRKRLKEIMERSGWNVIREMTMRTEALQDADWEIQAALHNSLREARELALPERFMRLLESEIDILKQLALPQENPPLNSFLLVADRLPSVKGDGDAGV